MHTTQLISTEKEFIQWAMCLIFLFSFHAQFSIFLFWFFLLCPGVLCRTFFLFFFFSNLLLVFQYLEFFLRSSGLGCRIFFLSLELSSLLSVVSVIGQGSTVFIYLFFLFLELRCLLFILRSLPPTWNSCRLKWIFIILSRF